jgi:hypothetical protein
LPETHAFFLSFVHYSSIHQSFIIHFSSRSAVGGRVVVVSTARDGYTWHRKTEKKQQRERERCCAALLKIQIGFSFCVQENAPIPVTLSEKEVRQITPQLQPSAVHWMPGASDLLAINC